MLVATRDHCFGVPGLSQIGERHNFEGAPWDLSIFLCLGKFAGLPPFTEIRFLPSSHGATQQFVDENFVNNFCLRLQKFSMVRGPVGPHHEKTGGKRFGGVNRSDVVKRSGGCQRSDTPKPFYDG